MKQKLFFIWRVLSIGLGSQAKPTFSFFNEMKSPALQQLFSDTTLIPTLVAMKAEIRMGIMDCTPERAEIIRQLNHAGIPVVAWLLLPEEEGYWFYSGNGDTAIRRYREIKQWADSNGLVLSGIGIDLEFDMKDILMLKSNPLKAVGKMYSRLYDSSPLEEGKTKYNELLQIIKSDGFRVESYVIPFIKDEVANGTTALQQFTQIIDVPVEKEIPMLYTSFMGNPDGILQTYALAPKARYVALGSTGGGVDTTLKVLTWPELVHDINRVAPFVDEIHIFSLEGAIQQRFLTQLAQLEISSAGEINQREVKNVEALRGKVIMVSKALSHPNWLLFGFAMVGILIIIGSALLAMFIFRKIFRRK